MDAERVDTYMARVVSPITINSSLQMVETTMSLRRRVPCTFSPPCLYYPDKVPSCRLQLEINVSDLTDLRIKIFNFHFLLILVKI